MTQQDQHPWPHLKLALFIVLAIGMCLRIGAGVILGMPDIVWSSEYGNIAGRLVQGQGYTFDFYGLRPLHLLHSFMPPLYTLLLAGVLWLFPVPTFGLGLIQACLSTLTCFFIYRIGEVQWDQRVGLIAAGVVAVYPVYVIQTARALPLTLNVFLLSALVYLVLSMGDGRDLAWRAAGTGLFLGLVGLSRPSFLGLGGGIVLWLWANHKQLHDVPGQVHLRWWQIALICAVVTALVLAPWMVRNLTVHHRFVPVSTNGGLTFWNGNNPFTTGSGFNVYLGKLEAYVGHPVTDVAGGEGPIVMLKPYPLPRGLNGVVATMDEVRLDRELYKAGFEFIRTHPRSWLSLLLVKIRSLWWFRPSVGDNNVFYRPNWVQLYRILYAGVAILFAVGVLLSLSRWREHVIFYYLFLYLTVVYAAFNVLTKYRWEVEQFMLLFGIAGVVALVDGVKTAWETRAGQVSADSL